MYSSLQLAGKYLKYYFNASNSKGFGTHSPFVYDFIRNVLNKKSNSQNYLIEKYRKRLLSDHRKIQVEDFGAGSFNNKNDFRSLSSIAESALKNQKYATLLARIAEHYHCKNIIELGTSLGTTTALLASEIPDSHVITMEGSQKIAEIADDFFRSSDLKNIDLIVGNFDDTIPDVLSKISTLDLLFVDGNHRKEPTIRYFHSFLPKIHNDSIFIFDDIHWSQEMEEAWQHIQEDEHVTLSIDLFFVGIVFFKEEIKEKQHFTIRF